MAGANGLHIARLCAECAQAVYNRTAPSNAQAECAGRLLFGTACIESGLKYDRQIGFNDDVLRGAWGFWQTEYAPTVDSVHYLEARPVLHNNVFRFLNQYGTADSRRAGLGFNPLGRMQAIKRSPALGVVFARLHYLRFPEAIPDALVQQAEYWKRLYNTVEGAGTVDKYVKRWREIGAPLWEQLCEEKGWI